MKILALDVETNAHLAHVWGLWGENIPLERLLDSGGILCWAAKWVGRKGIKYDSLNRNSKTDMLQGMRDLLDEADAVITYNGDKFDLPHINTEMVKLGISPPSPYKKIDLLKTVRKNFKFPSNKLAYVVEALGVGKKEDSGGYETWKGCLAGDQKSWARMEKYNKKDVTVLEALYDKLLPWIHNHPNVGMYVDSDKPVCSTCGGTHLQYRGTTVTKTQEYRRIQCQECNTWLREIVSVKKPERRGRLVVRES